MPIPRSHRHERALRAALAVTLGGVACTARAADPDDDDSIAPVAEGSATVPTLDVEAREPVEEPRVVTPVPADGSADEPILLGPANAEGSGGVETKCSAERDGQCPDSCDRNTDVDCCEGPDSPAGGLCSFSPQYGCRCAVIGPFNPPETPA